MRQSYSGHISPIDPGASFAIESSTLVIADHSSIGAAAADVAAVYDLAFKVMGGSVNPDSGQPEGIRGDSPDSRV